MKIRKAVIPAAGYGIRVLPSSKAVPKEMFPVVDKPAIQYLVEEAVASGIQDILIITSRDKFSIEDHFDRKADLEAKLLREGKQDVYNEVVRISNLAHIQFIHQQEPRGLGHAIYCARRFVGEEPFAVLYGDDLIFSQQPVCSQLCELYEKYQLGVVGMKEVPTEQVMKYCTLETFELEERVFKVANMIEKPKIYEIMSNYAILGRCVLPPKIFGILENLPEGANNEIQLTDAMKILAVEEGMIGFDFEGMRFDMGNKLGALEAAVFAGLQHPEVGSEFRKYIRSIAATLGKDQSTDGLRG